MGFPYISFKNTIQTSTVVFAANNVMGTGINTIAPVPTNGFIQGVTITSKSTLAAQVDVMFFTSSMPNSTFTDHSSIAISSVDAFNCGPVVSISSLSWSYGGTAATVGENNGLAYAYYSGSRSLYYAVIARQALIANSTADFSVAVTIVS